MQYPGGLAARYRWVGSGAGAAAFAETEAGGELRDLGTLVSPEPERLCRAELRVEGPLGAWTVRLASRIFDEPQALYWDGPGLLVVKYGSHVYALDGRTGEVAWHHASASPILAVLGSPRIEHVLAQAEIETFALDPDGAVRWRVAHSDVVTAVELIGGRLVLTGYGGQIQTLDPRSGRPA